MQVNTTGGLSKKLFYLSYERRLQAISGSWFGAWGLEKALWNFLVFKKVRAILGGRIRFILSGGAPLSGDTQQFINICLGWVLSIIYTYKKSTLIFNNTKAWIGQKDKLTQNANMSKNKESSLVSSPTRSTNKRQHA